MAISKLDKLLSGSCVLPNATTMDEFMYILTKSDMSCVNMKFGDINNLPKLIKTAHSHNKRVLLYMDSLKGVAKDSSGINFLARIGTDALATNKPQLIEAIRSEGMVAIHSMFLVDTNALKTGIKSIKQYKPDAVNIMPVSIHGRYVREIINQTGVKVTAGGLLTEVEELLEALDKGITAVITSKRELWESKNIFSIKTKE